LGPSWKRAGGEGKRVRKGKKGERGREEGAYLRRPCVLPPMFITFALLSNEGLWWRTKEEEKTTKKRRGEKKKRKKKVNEHLRHTTTDFAIYAPSLAEENRKKLKKKEGRRGEKSANARSPKSS